VFEAGIKGITPDAEPGQSDEQLTDALCGQIEEMITGVLSEVETEGFKPSHLRAELNKLEFAIREFGAGGSPKGLTLFLGAVGRWIYGHGPIEEMRFADALRELRGSLEGDARAFFAKLIRVHLLGNEHTVTLHSAPSATLAEDLIAAEAAAVRDAVTAMSDEEQASLATAASTLQMRQAAPDTPEALATVPQLHRSDLRREAAQVLREERELDGAMVLACALPATNGISHVAVSVDIGWALPAELVQWAPLFTELLTSTGTAEDDEEATSHRIGEHTGGVSAGIHASPVPGSRRLAQVTMTIGGKALGPSVPQLAAILIDLLKTAPLAKRSDILLKHVREGIAGLEGSIGSAGHRHAMMAANASLSLPGEMHFVMGGYPQLQFLRQLRRRLESSLESERLAAQEEAVAAMEQLRAIVLAERPEPQGTHSKPLVTVAASPDDVEAAIEAGLLVAAATRSSSGESPLASSAAVSAAGSLHGRGSYVHADAFAPLAAQGLPGGFMGGGQGGKQAFIVPSSVSYVASAGIGYSHGKPVSQLPPGTTKGMLQPDQIAHPRGHPHATVDFATPATANAASSMASMGHLWERIRVQSNAYGAGCSADPISGGIGFWSYRDPRVMGTLADFEKTAAWLREADGGMDQATIDGTVITAVAGLDKPLSPADKASQSATRWSLGLGQAQVQARRDALLEMSKADVEDFSQAVSDSMGEARSVCTVVGREMAEAEGIIDAGGAARGDWRVIDVFGGQRS
jgi:Zn-dependent M16 (insulinase) family peptidase